MSSTNIPTEDDLNLAAAVEIGQVSAPEGVRPVGCLTHCGDCHVGLVMNDGWALTKCPYCGSQYYRKAMPAAHGYTSVVFKCGTIVNMCSVSDNDTAATSIIIGDGCNTKEDIM